MSNMRIRNMFLLVMVMTIMVLFACSDGTETSRTPVVVVKEVIVTPTPVPTPIVIIREVIVTPTPESTATAIPESTATAIPESTATAIPEPTATAIPEPTAIPELSTVEIMASTNKSVVQIFNSNRCGTGFIIRQDGLIITNAHVIEGKNSGVVILSNGQRKSWNLVNKDEQIDLALIKIEIENIPPLEFGDSKTLLLGQKLAVIGYPSTIIECQTGSATITTGIISSFRDNLDPWVSAIQTDAAINPGNSGGPVLDYEAKVIGIATARFTEREGMNLAIPSDQAKKISDRWMRFYDDGTPTPTATSMPSTPIATPVSPPQKTAQQYYDEGMNYIKNGNYDDAIDKFDMALNVDSRYSESHILHAGKGEAYYRAELYSEAIVSLTRAIEIDDRYYLDFYRRASSHYFLGEYNEAIKDFSAVINLDKTCPCEHLSTFERRGYAYKQIELYNDAISDLTEAIKLDGSYWTYNTRGVAYLNLKQNDQALEDFNKSIELKPDYHYPHRNKGVVYQRREDYETAIEHFSTAIELKYDYSSAYFGRAYSYGKLDNHQQAIDDYTKAIIYNPQSDASYNNRGIKYKLLGEYDKALSDYNSAIELAPDDDVYINNRNNLLREHPELRP